MDKAMVPQSLLLLRGAGDENALLHLYSEKAHLPWFFQLPGELLSSSNRFYSEGSSGKVMEATAREVYYRVKGRPFNTAPRTKLSFLWCTRPLLAPPARLGATTITIGTTTTITFSTTTIMISQVKQLVG